MGRPALPAKWAREFFTADPAPSSQATAPAKASKTTAVTNAVGRYDAAGQGRRLKGWNPSSAGPNRSLQGLQKIRDRSRDSSRNDWASSAGNRRWVTTLIGTGIVPRPKRGTAKEARQKQVDLWTRWCAYADADCVLDFYGLQTLSTLAWMDAGECFARLRYRREDAGFEVPLQVQLIEADYVPLLDADVWPGMITGNRIRQGVEFSRIGQRVAYWCYREHPTDGFSGIVDMSKLIRVPADEMIHIFEPLRPGQIRGVPDSAPVLTYIREMLDFRGTVLERQKLANLIMAFIKKPPLNPMDAKTDPLTGAPIDADFDGSPMIGLEPGTVQELLPGEEMQWSNPPEAGTTYSDYVRTENLALAAGRNLPHEVLTGDIKDVSDRTLRIVIKDFRRFAEQRQFQIIIPQFCQKVRNAFVVAAALAGLVPLAEVEDWRAVQWQPQGWPDIHPFQDIQGRQMQIDGGHRSRSSVIAETGYDPMEVDEERLEDKEREDELGLTPKVGDIGPDGKPIQGPKDDDEEEKKKAKDMERFFDGVTSRLELIAKAPPPAPPAPVTNNYTLPPITLNATITPTAIEAKFENTTVVEPTPVQITNEQHTHVEPTPVQITNEVKPAEVDLTVDLKMPDRQTTSVIDRNDRGDITNVTQTETTLQ